MTQCRTYRITGTHEGSAQRMPVCYENHAQDSRVQGPIHVAPTFGHSNANSMGVSGNNPLIIQFLDKNAIIRSRIRAVCWQYERSGEWPEDEWVDISPDVALNIYTDMDGCRRATAFQKTDLDLEFGVDIEYVGEGAPA